MPRIVGGLPVGPDGRIHCTLTRDPETLRSACKNPNMQNLPRGSMYGVKIRDLIMAQPGSLFLARDYSGIEAVLVGWFAKMPEYIRLAKIDVHSYYTAYALNALDGRVASSDLPDISWPDEKLIPHLAWIKKTFKEDRNNLYKHLVHGANFMQGPMGAKEKILLETGIDYPVQLVSKVMKVYFELFKGIKTWHHNVLDQVERDGYIRNPFGYVQRFSKVYDYENVGGVWHKEPGPDSNKVIASGPQSTAAGIITEAMLRLYQNRFEEAGKYLRLLVHDELLLETPEDQCDTVDQVMVSEMEKPIPELPLPKEWNMGSNLVILTEGKRGPRWGSMQ